MEENFILKKISIKQLYDYLKNLMFILYKLKHLHILYPWKFKMEQTYIKEKIYNYIDGLAEWLKQWNPPGL